MGAEKINVLDDLNAIFYAKEASDRGFQDVFSSFETNDSEFVLTADELISKPLNEKENRISFESGKFSILSEAMPLDFSFDEFFLILPKKPILNVEDLKRKYFHELFFAKDLERIELLKRSSMPLIIIISALIAASLTMRLKDSGRFYIFLSGLIIFMSYYGLSLSQEVFSNFSLNSTFVFFSIHGIYLIAAIMLALDQSYQNLSFNLGSLKYSRNFMINLFVLFLIATVFSYLVFYVFL
jgi:lipopolysaccharide export LptBFGC system permease protein LptF